MKTGNTTEPPICIALNMSEVLNNEESFNLMNKVGPRVYITTATHPGFIGFIPHFIRGPYVMFFQPMMEEPGWRSFLS